MAEKKYGEVIPTGWTALSTGAPTPQDYTAFTQGDGIDYREGNKVRLLGYKYKINLTYSTSWFGSAYTMCAIRIVLFRWKPDNYVDSPVIGDILEVTSSASTRMWSDYVFDPVKRRKFNILHDERVHVGSPYSGTASAPPNASHALPYKEITLQGSLNDVLTFQEGAITGKNHIYFMAFYEQVGEATGATPFHPGIMIQGKMRFNDS